jgi:hypothetical protein
VKKLMIFNSLLFAFIALNLGAMENSESTSYDTPKRSRNRAPSLVEKTKNGAIRISERKRTKKCRPENQFIHYFLLDPNASTVSNNAPQSPISEQIEEAASTNESADNPSESQSPITPQGSASQLKESAYKLVPGKSRARRKNLPQLRYSLTFDFKKVDSEQENDSESENDKDQEIEILSAQFKAAQKAFDQKNSNAENVEIPKENPTILEQVESLQPLKAPEEIQELAEKARSIEELKELAQQFNLEVGAELDSKLKFASLFPEDFDKEFPNN